MNQLEDVKSGRDQYRVVIGSEANRGLEALVEKINSGYEAVDISKSDLANFIFKKLDQLFSENLILEVRKSYFDPKKALEGMLKGNSEIPESLRSILLKHCGVGVSDLSKRRGSNRNMAESNDFDPVQEDTSSSG